MTSMQSPAIDDGDPWSDVEEEFDWHPAGSTTRDVVSGTDHAVTLSGTITISA